MDKQNCVETLEVSKPPLLGVAFSIVTLSIVMGSTGRLVDSLGGRLDLDDLVDHFLAGKTFPKTA